MLCWVISHSIPPTLMKLFQGGVTLQNNFKNLTCWMYRFIDSNHHQNNFWLEIILMGYPPLKIILTKTLSQQKKIFRNNFGVWPCFDPMAYSTFGWRNVVHSRFCRLCSHSTSSQWWQCCNFRRKRCRTMRYPILRNVGLAKVAYYFLGFLFFRIDALRILQRK